MRNKILFILLISGAFVVGGLTVVGYQDYRDQQAVQHQAKVAEQQKLDQAEAERAARESAERKKLQESCASLQAVYEKLTPFQKTQATKPDCNMSQVE